jgi:hypothetical protein
MITRVHYHFPRKYPPELVERIKALAAAPAKVLTHDEVLAWIRQLSEEAESRCADQSSLPSSGQW